MSGFSCDFFPIAKLSDSTKKPQNVSNQAIRHSDNIPFFLKIKYN